MIIAQDFRTTEKDPNMIMREAKNLIRTSTSLGKIQYCENRKLVCNDGGGILFDKLSKMESSIYAQQIQLDAQRKELDIFKRHFLSVRERGFLTYLRNFWGDFGNSAREKSTPKTQLALAISKRIKSFNTTLIHSGNVEFDAIMFIERKPIADTAPFAALYGVGPEKALDLGNHSLLVRVYTHINICF